MRNLLFLPILLVLFTTACTSVDRSRESGYGNGRAPRTSFSRSSTTMNQDGMVGDQENISQRTRLKQLENSLSTRKETDQYSKALPWFAGDAERIDFLSLPGFEARQRWLTQRDFNSRSASVQSEMKELVEAQDIAVGMPLNLVKQSWGEPNAVEVSGNPQFKNERWHYNKYVSTQDGYKPEKKIVYFEGGKVVGWEIE